MPDTANQTITKNSIKNVQNNNKQTGFQTALWHSPVQKKNPAS